MGRWLLWTTRQLLCSISCAQSIAPLLNEAPMDRLPASAAMGPGSYPITHGTEPGVIPEGHSVIQIAQPVCYPVWKPNPVPILYADHGRYEYEPATVLTHYVVPRPMSPA
jgi:hypothetical protein